jgi:drug/metabolite transporter (DMT)-like permease
MSSRSSKKSLAPLGAGLVALSSLFYASYGIWMMLMGDFFGSFTASALRCLLVVAGLFIIALMRRELQKIEWGRDRKWLITMLLSSALVSAPFYYSVLHAGVGISLATTYVGIVTGMFVCGWLFEGERFTQDKFIAMALGAVGLVLVFSPTIAFGGEWFALAAALISGFATAVCIATTKKIPYNGSQSALLVWGAGVIANVPLVFLFGESLPPVGWHAEWAYLLLFAAASLIASWTFIRGLKLIEAGAAGVLGLLEVVFGVLFGVVFFHERPGVIVVLGIISIILAAAIPYLHHYNSQKGTLEE